MRNRILGQKRRLELDFGSDPFAFGVRRIRSVIAASAAAKLRAEVGALDLVERLDLAPGFVTDSSGDVDFQSHDQHRAKTIHHGDTESLRKNILGCFVFSVSLCLRGEKLAMRKPLVQHEVYEHAGDVDVQDRKS